MVSFPSILTSTTTCAIVIVLASKSFDKVESIIYDTAGQPHTKSFVEENGIPSNNPTNSKKVQKKSHYDDDAWIIRTAISQYENDDGVYSDIYEVVGNISEKMP